MNKKEKICLIYDGLNVLIPLICSKPIYNSKMFNIFPIMGFLKRIFNDIINFLDYFNIENKNVSKFDFLVNNNLLQIFFNENVDIFIIFDFGSDIARRKVSSSYKSDREHRRKLSLKENLEHEITNYRSILYDILSYFGYKTIIIPFVEGDAIIYYLSKKMKDNYKNVVVISNDSDLLECIGDNIVIFNQRSKKVIDDSIESRKNILYLQKYIRDLTYKFYPSIKNISYFKALRGDQTDGIKMVIRKNKFDLFMKYIIREKIEFIESLDNLFEILNKTIGPNQYNKTQIIENFSLISLQYYIDHHLKPNDIISLQKIISNPENNSPNIENLIKELKNFELTDYRFGWLVS